jgi:hypothetical protein
MPLGPSARAATMDAEDRPGKNRHSLGTRLFDSQGANSAAPLLSLLQPCVYWPRKISLLFLHVQPLILFDPLKLTCSLAS